MESTEIDPAYLGDVSARMFELQAERVRLLGEGASPAELRRIDDQIAPLQVFIDEHAEEYARMEMPREITKTVRVPERLREKAPGLKEQLIDLQTRYDLTTEQLASETDPEARAALENGIDSLRERIHGLKADVPWEKEDRLLAKGTLKRSSAARLKARERAPADFEAAEMDRAVLIDLRNTYGQALESGELPKAGESLMRGAVQTVEDALNRYGRGDLSSEGFQARAKDISKARKMWDRYVTDEIRGDFRKAAKEQEAAIRARMEEERVVAEKARKEGQNEEIRRRLKKVAEKQDAEKAVRVTKKQTAEAQAEVEKFLAMEMTLSEAARQRAGVRARIAEKMGRLKEKARERRGADVKEALTEIRHIAPPDEESEVLEADRHLAPPPENLPVAEERRAGAADIAAKVKTFKGLTAVGRGGMYDIVRNAALGMKRLSARERTMVEVQYPDWTGPDFAALQEQLDRENREIEAAKKFRSEARFEIGKVTQESVDRVNAKVSELQKKIHAEQQRLAGDVSESDTEARFFSQGEKPGELAKREQAIERFGGENVRPDEAVAEQEKIEAVSARDFENEIGFTAAFLDAVEKDPSHRISITNAQEYAKNYWKLLMKDNDRMAEAMKPHPKVGFFRRLLGGGPKAKETMKPEEVVKFQEMDKLVRDIMESPATSMHSIRKRGPERPSTPWTSGRTGRPGS